MKFRNAIYLSMIATSCSITRPTSPTVSPSTTWPVRRDRPDTVTVDFQTGFVGNWIQLTIDGESIFSGALTTDNRIGLAGRLHLHHVPSSLSRHSKPAFDATVTLDRTQSQPFHVDLRRGRHIGLSRNLDDHSIHLTQSQEAFQYD